MFKKICFSLFLFFLIALIIGILMTQFSTKTFYCILLASLVFRILPYSPYFSFQNKQAILLWPMIVVLLFPQKYKDGLLLINNVCMGSLGFVFYAKIKKITGSKCQ